MELILSRHARKLLMARCLRDLGRFAAHLDFNLQGWMVRERWVKHANTLEEVGRGPRVHRNNKHVMSLKYSYCYGVPLLPKHIRKRYLKH